MAYTFLKAKGQRNRKIYFLDEEKVKLAAELIKRAEEKGVKLMLPIDIVTAKEFNNESERAG